MPQSRVFVILTLIITIQSALAAINYEILTDNEHPDKCVINTSKGQMIVGSLKSVHHPTKCAQVECGKDGWALVYTCDDKNPPTGCEFDGYQDITADFPECCQMNIKCNYV